MEPVVVDPSIELEEKGLLVETMNSELVAVDSSIELEDKRPADTMKLVTVDLIPVPLIQ